VLAYDIWLSFLFEWKNTLLIKYNSIYRILFYTVEKILVMPGIFCIVTTTDFIVLSSNYNNNEIPKQVQVNRKTEINCTHFLRKWVQSGNYCPNL